MVRGEIWWAKLPDPRGSEPGKKRPVLIIQADAFTSSSINTVICAVITSNTALAMAPGNLLLTKKESHLPKSSVVNVSQLITLDKSYFLKYVSALNKRVLKELDNSLKTVLELQS